VRDVENAHGLPKAKRQARRVSGQSRLPRPRYLDNLYQGFGLVVELDGRADHLVEDRWSDIRRDNANARSGVMTLRYNWADVTRRPCDVAADVASALRIRGWGAAPRCCGPCCSARLLNGVSRQSY
jgi:very-short-patch-repair endonuclease